VTDLLTRRPLVTRRTATAGDDTLLRTLFAELHDDLWILPPDVRDALLDMQFRTQRSQFRTEHPDADHEILVVDGSAVGRIVVDRSGAQAQLVDITIGRRHRRRGLAAEALGALLAEVGDRVVSTAVPAGNSGALRLFERLGFAVVAGASGPEGRVRLERMPSAS
jgi:RimJ/RimL family protein N-acetyltransferase